jgi:hypothetical protein
MGEVIPIREPDTSQMPSITMAATGPAVLYLS